MKTSRARALGWTAPAAVVGLLCATPVMAQTRHVPARGGRIAGMAPPPPPVVVAPPVNSPYGGYGYGGYGYGPGPYGVVVVQPSPAVLLPDGRMYVNFGYGYEPVAQTCGASMVWQGRVYQPPQIYGFYNGVVQVMPPSIPAQSTSSEVQLMRALSPSSVAALPGPLSSVITAPTCWSNYGGNVVVFRP